jgi:hypothetical protein
MKITEVERHRYNKGRILQLLAKEYPNGLDIVILRRVLANLNIALSHRDICAYVAYLEQIGYAAVTRADLNDNGREEFDEILFVVCTTKGLNFIDGLLPAPDPGVAILP